MKKRNATPKVRPQIQEKVMKQQKKERDETEKIFGECQDKYHQLNLSNIINEAMLKKCDDESQRK